MGVSLCGIAGSADVEHGLAADAALRERVERSGCFSPRRVERALTWPPVSRAS